MATLALTSLSHGAGCGCKISAADLRPIVAGLPPGTDPRVLVGRGLHHLRAVGGVEPVGRLERLREDALQRGRRRGDHALGLLEALGVAELLHGGLDLGLRVFAARRHPGIIGPRCRRP